MSVLAIILIVLGAIVLLGVLGGYLATRRRDRARAAEFERHLQEAERALETAFAADKGWDRDLLDQAARAALAESHPGSTFNDLHLVLVDDRPGIDEDRAQILAVGPQSEARVVLARRGDGWVAERVE